MTEADFQRLEQIVRLRHLGAGAAMTALLGAIGDVMTPEQNESVVRLMARGATIELRLVTKGAAPASLLEVVLGDERILLHQIGAAHDVSTLQ